MGQLMSTSRDYHSNDELTNAMVRMKSLFTTDVERAFRCVDRSLYFIDSEKRVAFRDTAWMSDPVHLSAPSVYATVLECLELRNGNKFLNIGSGVGYLNTVAGLLLGINGVNHGIEINKSVIDCALLKLEEFKLKAAAIDYYNFCEPIFVHGNACELLATGFYDRVYCGASVPPEELQFLKSLVNIGGILVMPLDGCLLKVTRQNEHSWKTDDIIDVSFSNLVVPEKCSFNTVKFPKVEPLSLQELCRSSIRSSLRERLIEEFPELSIRSKCLLKTNEQKNIDNNDPNVQSTHPSMHQCHEEMLQNIVDFVDTFAALDNALSDIDSESDGEFNDLRDIDNVDEIDGNESDHDNESTNENIECPDSPSSTPTETSDESTKRKSVEAGSSVQNESLVEEENPKRMRMNLSSNRIEGQPSTSSDGGSDLWETMSSHSSRSSSTPVDTDANNDTNVFPTHRLGGLYQSLFEPDLSEEESDTSSEDARDLINYKFAGDSKENKLSTLLKVKIDLLPIPVSLKRFLNYNRCD